MSHAVPSLPTLRDWQLHDHLQCVAFAPDGTRCPGPLHRAAPDEPLSCVRCRAPYAVVEGVVVTRSDSDSEIAHAVDGQIYRAPSRRDSLAGKDLYLAQSQGMIHYLDRLRSQGLIHGPTLEIGCGIGIFADHVPGYVGLDYSLSALLAEGFEGYRRVCASGDLLPFRDETFRTIFSLNTLEHVPELERCFREMDRILMPGGVLVLKPAWNCMQYNCDGVGYFPYRDLSWRNRVLKPLLPVLRSKPYKALTRIPWRAVRHVTGGADSRLQWKRLRPRFDLIFKVADAEAFAQIDICECIRWFVARGYACPSHPSLLRRLCAGHEFVCLVKPAAAVNGRR